MAFTEIEIKRCEKALAQFMDRRRPPPDIRDELDLLYGLTGHSLEIFEIRPDWQDRTKKMETPVAKTTFVRTKNHWKVFWRRQDLKWHGYGPSPEVKTLKDFLDIVDRDAYGCFFG